jgi:hypothetical protein
MCGRISLRACNGIAPSPGAPEYNPILDTTVIVYAGPTYYCRAAGGATTTTTTTVTISTTPPTRAMEPTSTQTITTTTTPTTMTTTPVVLPIKSITPGRLNAKVRQLCASSNPDVAVHSGA